jgi:hypothetical protein
MGQEVVVLKHIRELWSRLQDAIDEVDFHVNTVIMRIYMLMREFVDSGFVGRLRDLHKTSLFGGCTTASLTEDPADTGVLWAPKADMKGAAGKKQTGSTEAGKLPKYTHELDLQGNPYVNSNGYPYTNSVCDWCEKEGHSHFHHPLRCGRCFPRWKTHPPELHGETTWYTRPE